MRIESEIARTGRWMNVLNIGAPSYSAGTSRLASTSDAGWASATIS